MSAPANPIAREIKSFRILVCGTSQVGKSCLISRFAKDAYDEDFREHTYVARESAKLQWSQNQLIMVQLIEVGGIAAAKDKSLLQNEAKRADAVISVYDTTDLNSIFGSRFHCNNVFSSNPGLIRNSMLFGSKTDQFVGLESDMQREIAQTAYNLSISYNRDHPMIHLTGSSYDGKNVSKAVCWLISEAYGLPREGRCYITAQFTNTSDFIFYNRAGITDQDSDADETSPLSPNLTLCNDVVFDSDEKRLDPAFDALRNQEVSPDLVQSEILRITTSSFDFIRVDVTDKDPKIVKTERLCFGRSLTQPARAQQGQGTGTHSQITFDISDEQDLFDLERARTYANNQIEKRYSHCSHSYKLKLRLALPLHLHQSDFFSADSGWSYADVYKFNYHMMREIDMWWGHDVNALKLYQRLVSSNTVMKQFDYYMIKCLLRRIGYRKDENKDQIWRCDVRRGWIKRTFYDAFQQLSIDAAQKCGPNVVLSDMEVRQIDMSVVAEECEESLKEWMVDSLLNCFPCCR